MSTPISPLKRTLMFLFTSACISIAICSIAETAIAQSKSDKITKVTFKKDKFNRIFLPAKIDGDTIGILFGTYSKPLRLTPYFAETWQLYPSWDRLILTDKNGRRRNRMLFYLPKLEIGNIKFYNEETVVNNSFPDSVATGSTGTLLVQQYNWRVDNDRNEVSLSKKPFIPSQPFITISYKKDTSPETPVEIAGITSDFALDFGSGSNFQVNSNTPMGQQLITTYKLKPKTTLVSNVHARKMVDTLYEVTIPTLLLNGTELKNQKITISSASPNNVIGTGLLGNYNVILNNSKKRKILSTMILEKRLVN